MDIIKKHQEKYPECSKKEDVLCHKISLLEEEASKLREYIDSTNELIGALANKY